MKFWRTLCVVIGMGSLATGAAPSELAPIALGSFGNEDFAKSYRLLVEEALIENGFKVVTETEHPVATLGGAVVTVFRNYMQTPNLLGILRLTSSDGKVIWSWHPKGNQDPQDWPPGVVEDLRKAIKLGKVKLPVTNP